MQTSKAQQRLLANTAIVVCKELKEHAEDTRLQLHGPRNPARTDTDGWCVSIGTLGKNGPSLDIWLDRHCAYAQRKFWFGLYWKDRSSLRRLATRVERRLRRPRRTITWADVQKGKYNLLSKPLPRNQFGTPIFEDFTRWAFFGMYDASPLSNFNKVNLRLCARIVGFFDAVAHSVPLPSPVQDVYPQIENRRVVSTHLRRERSGALVRWRKSKDRYVCRVCGFSFKDLYGELGRQFAEAHHCRPLSSQVGPVASTIVDLVSVCANCHRMLHKMSGQPSDVGALRRIVAKQRKR